MKVSVIVPVYNAEVYLSECIQSILQQNYRDTELILVDDGSTDTSPRLCDEFAEKDSRIRVIHKKNGGAADARNAGILAAQGEYLCFVDSDDFLLDDAVFSKLIEILAKTNAQMVQYGQLKYYPKENRLMTRPLRNLSSLNDKTTPEVLDALVQQGQLSISACSMLVSRDFLLKNQLLFEKGIRVEDLEWSIRLFLQQPKMAFCDEYFYAYRKQQEKSVTASIDYKHLCEYCYIIEKCVPAIAAAEPSMREPLLSYLMYHIMIAGALCHRVRLSKKERRELLNRIRPIYRKYIVNNHKGKKAEMGYLVYRLIGFTGMIWGLGQYLIHRSR